MGSSFGEYWITRFEKSDEYTINLLDSKNKILESQKLGFVEDKAYGDEMCVRKNKNGDNGPINCKPVDLKINYQFEFIEGAYKIELYKGDKKITEAIIQGGK